MGLNRKARTAEQKAAQAAYAKAWYLKKKQAREANPGYTPGANQWTVGHRMTGSPEYKSYQAMKARCLNTKCKDFSRYGGRGIGICDSWMASFENFYADMGPRPEGATLERRNNALGYSPENCCWASRTEQTRNRRCARVVELHGVSRPLAVWCEMTGRNYYTAHRKLYREGKSPAEVFLGKPGVDAGLPQDHKQPQEA